MRKPIAFCCLMALCALWTYTSASQELTLLEGENLRTEVPVYTNQDGEAFSKHIYLKFRDRVVPDRPTDTSDQLLTEHGSVGIRTLFGLIKAQFGGFEVRKVHPRKSWADSTVYNRRSKEMVQAPNLSQTIVIQFDELVSVSAITSMLDSNSEIEYAEGPPIIHLTDSPDDWVYINGPQWSLEIIDAEDAWDYSKGNGVKIAIIDAWESGIAVHTDLDGRLVNSFGYYGDHGTWVASVAGSITDNYTGMASLGWDVDSLKGYTISATSIEQATDDGVDVINNSWVTTGNSSTIEDAVEYALCAGVVVVASAGNDELCTSCIKYPAAYNFEISGVLTQVIAVSGTYADDDFVDGWSYSPGTDPTGNLDSAYVDVGAPGAETSSAGDGVWVAYSYSTGGTHTHVKREGTSMSAPMVSALAALLISADGSLTVAEIYDLITGSTEKVGQYSYDSNGWNRYLGYGRINAYYAVCSAVSTCSLPGPTTLTVTNSGSIGQRPSLRWNSGPGLIDHYEVYRQKYGQSWTLLGTTSDTTYTDNSIYIASHVTGDIYYYKVRGVDFSEEETSYSNTISLFGDNGFKQDPSSLSKETRLYPNYPNPASGETSIRFDLVASSDVSLVIYDVMGREIVSAASGTFEEGEHSITLDTETLPNGIYFYRLSVGAFVETKKMTVFH